MIVIGRGWLEIKHINSNFQIYKISNKLTFNYKSGVSLGGAIAFSEAMNISNTGDLSITTTSSGFLTLRKRLSPSTYDPQIYMKSGGYSNYGVICASQGILHGWTTSNSTGELSGSYNYVLLNGDWTNSSNGC